MYVNDLRNQWNTGVNYIGSEVVGMSCDKSQRLLYEPGRVAHQKRPFYSITLYEKLFGNFGKGILTYKTDCEH